MIPLGQPPRLRGPHLIPAKDPRTYGVMDTWDASTPEELHEASWGIWIRSVLQGSPGMSRTLFLVGTPLMEPIEDIVWLHTPRGFVAERTVKVFARQIRDHQVVRRCWVYAVVGLPPAAAMSLPFYRTLAPVLWSPTGSPQALAIPPAGPSTKASLLDPVAITRVLKDTYVEAFFKGPAIDLWREVYGFNPIAEFRRHFERSTPTP